MIETIDERVVAQVPAPAVVPTPCPVPPDLPHRVRISQVAPHVLDATRSAVSLQLGERVVDGSCLFDDVESPVRLADGDLVRAPHLRGDERRAGHAGAGGEAVGVGRRRAADDHDPRAHRLRERGEDRGTDPARAAGGEPRMSIDQAAGFRRPADGAVRSAW
jgi:hypothetical protein